MSLARIVELLGSDRPVAWSGVATLATAADDNRIVTSTNMKNSTYTIAAQPLYPCLISFTATASGTADTMGTITIVGKHHAQSESITEVVTPVAGSTVWSTNAYGVITSLTGAGWVIDAGAGNDTIIVGVAQEAALYCGGKKATVMCLTNNLYINPAATAVADATAIKLTADKIPNSSVTMQSSGNLSLISADSATFQYIVWGQ